MGLLDFLSLRRKAPDVLPAYTAIMAQARRPDYYGAGKVPDSFDGRFDFLSAHVHLVLRRLRTDGVAREEVGQALFDVFFRDMDQAMRESGVGDLGVGKRIRKMAQAFYGRASAYDEALGKAAPARATKAVKARLVDVLTRNLYPETPTLADAAGMADLAAHLLDLEKQLAKKSLEDILAGHVFDV